MAVTVAEASARYANFMVNPAPGGPGVCPNCRGFPSEGFTLCYGCSRNGDYLDAIVPITYSVHLEQMHHELRGYKEDEYPEAVRARFRVGLTAVLWRFLRSHEDCVAGAVGASGFDHVVTVPSSTSARDGRPGGLHTIVGEMCGHTRDRHVRALAPTDRGAGRDFDPNRYQAVRDVDGATILLIDDTWTSGGHAQSGGHTLREAGATTIACVVIGRHVHRNFAKTGEVLDGLPRFDWDYCVPRGNH